VTDYLQELEFGLFPSPEADRADEILALAQLAEVLGLDVVSVQDHPYQAKYLDTWTLLSFLGARTTTIKLSPNVASLPLRPPVVLAKSTATLDVLTGGRVELGLGAGAFWDAIVAAGGPRRKPGEAVAALEEAVVLMKQLWAGGSVRFEGEHYSAKGLHAGPVPPHDIPIWIGAYKPKMLRLTGRLADGWVPSMGYADPPALPALIEQLDEAAVEAGRDPASIKRIYNVFGSFGSGDGSLRGDVADWAEQLATWALELGMSTFILGTDDPTTLRRFADEVVPTVKEVVDYERARRAAAPDVDSDPDDPVPVEVHDDPPAYDEPINPAGQHLVDIHDHLRSELDSIRQVLEQVSSGHVTVGSARSVINTMTLRQNNWTLGAYCESYCRIVTGHHTLEDHSVFPHLRQAQPDLAPVLDRLQSEHEVIHALLDDFDRALVRLVTDDGTGQSGRDALETVRTSLDELADQLLAHLSYEESQLVEPLGRHGFG
jgi:alkanesulfonate monooxygenase SsuD/methylene tetrahydromethanopterin reductase-like flavin-dependent oxidoreductase (luciferase family)/hemerythrin-like domain-containing protein